MTTWAENHLERAALGLTAETLPAFLRLAGGLVAGGGFPDILTAEAFVIRHVAARSIPIPPADVWNLELQTGLADPVRPGVDRSRYVLIPGQHIDDTGSRLEIGVDQFAGTVLRAFPRDLLYRSGGVVGVIDGPPGGRSFAPVTATTVRSFVDCYTRLGRWKPQGRAAALFYVSCTLDLATTVLDAAARDPIVRDLDLLTSYPVFRTTGLTTPGFADGAFYDVPPELTDLPEPGDPDTVLRDLVVDFPFDSDASRTNFLSLLLTPFMRPALRGPTPFFLVGASLPGSGKSMLIKSVFGGIVTGKPTPETQWPENETEAEKRITESLLRGGTILNLDNIRDFVDSAAMSSLITSSTWEGRPLFRGMVRLANNFVVVGSGNNVKVTAEIARRIVPIILQPTTDHPESRTEFHHKDIASYILSRRPLVVSTILAMVRSWIAAGRPPGTVPMGSFDRWASCVGGVMQYHGFSAWMTNYRDWKDRSTPERDDILALIRSWVIQKNGIGSSAKELWELAKSIGVFLKCDKPGASASIMSFQKSVLQKYEDAPVGEWMIRSSSVNHMKLYRLEKMGNSPESGVESNF